MVFLIKVIEKVKNNRDTLCQEYRMERRSGAKVGFTDGEDLDEEFGPEPY
jgi:hypothetical protein